MTQPIDLNAEKAKRKHRKKTEQRVGWESQLLLDRFDRVKGCLSSAMLVLTEHPEWKGIIAFDSFKQAVTTLRPPPTRENERPVNHSAGEWTDATSVRTAAWLSQEYSNSFGVQTVDSAVSGIAEQNSIHPVRSYLKALKWDAKIRLPKLFASYFGADDTSYAEAIGVRFMISAVARVMDPGCKVDNLVVLEGPQGIGKSTAARVLAKNAEWFSDTGVVLGDKDSYQCLRGVWLYELAELASVRAVRDVERYKAFFSSPIDTYRPSYGRRNVQIPRQTIFIGTTNELEYLHDKSGNRRFWPVKCTRVDLESLRSDVDMLWAEAVTRYESREAWHVDTVDLAEQCREQQAEREQVDPWVQFVADWLAPEWPVIRSGDDYERINKVQGVTTADVLRGAIGMAKDRIDRAAETRAGQALRHLGWESQRFRLDGERVRKYFGPAAG